MPDYQAYCIDKNTTLLEAMKKMDELDIKLLMVTEGDRFYSLLSIGDIQRYLIKNQSIDDVVDHALRKDIKVAGENDPEDFIRQQMIDYRMAFIPVVRKDGTIRKVIFWQDLFEEEKQQDTLNCPVVIMAGGKGTRLRPITNIIPKPLIPIGDKTILEIIMEKFYKFGVRDFYISVNYKSEMIEYYFDQIEEKRYELNFFKESKPLGTAGSLHLLRLQLDRPFFVTNCDIIIDQDYDEIMTYHLQNGNEMTAVAAVKHEVVPYGVFDVEKDGVLKDVTEKPENTYMINAGMYILEPHLLEEIPDNEFFHITDLMKKLLRENRKVGIFPVSEGAWSDVGEWKNYRQTASRLSGDEF